MGFMLRVRLASFFAGAAAAGAAGGFFLYKDYKLAHDSMALQVKGLQDHVDARYKALDKRLATLEDQKTSETAPDVGVPSD
ncbi:uncharacterized protein [Oryza sativa Japonica Group]|uniref:Os05g0535700 protein n=2 Tax=Oryza sativa subsp. japonica TaxID=39947 RepID=Q6L5I8_ORYSJ|nr:uncharacterized protein LOC4339442 [Oryza sativa Japonica Group]XP_052157463.1 uncharacterized protein LOC127775181 [Oryza glaberrima]KAB8100356.1 hypothetical protein EE612_030856 [Oryza sativa]AAT39211.1 unknown protein [Oryza sativa Japonica Group]KAF2931834.1 hypothetical protein DAI22_05g240300 [Oryza sativa Japonica Group]BAF18072.1 Os05g0535700 [Oryza sativa Japonica Group]BAG88026.1 unnamed protein product [Oryza sativa Japonica Group]|eukprot:NP_001056158.1 Os05g0535700 [Oryza sativa Japonica Group]